MTTKNTFEKSVQELDTIVIKMESGELSLDESLKLFEQGVKLTRACQKTLADAENRIEKLMTEIEQKL
ncbi:MAG: exodeoxyribonuclease VII small subunit [Alcanivoracaceae bacterium]|nr:exodeoxyribonuclease VII small subunit [Alcanivoracaceae bacterium]